MDDNKYKAINLKLEVANQFRKFVREHNLTYSGAILILMELYKKKTKS